MCRVAYVASGASVKMWENQLTIGLIESNRPAFQKVSSCQIKMKAITGGTAMAQVQRRLRASTK
jgi:hypothetical protein